jgi:tetratricopeptide (TPR) repeat protein
MSIQVVSKLVLAIALRVCFAIAITEVIVLFNILTPIAKAQNSYSQTPISTTAIDEAANLYQQGKVKAKQQNYRGAIADLSKAIQLNPNQADYYYQRGLILAELEAQEGAIQDFDAAILRNPNHAWAYFHRAGVSFGFGANPPSFSRSRLNSDLDYDLDIDDPGYRTTGFRPMNARAMLDLKTARDLFAQQGNQEGYQLANRLIQYFGGS